LPGQPLVVALTGGIASGKTAVSDRLAALGAKIIDTDLIARELVEPGAQGLEGIVRHFGAGILDAEGRLDRASMRERAFADPAQRRQLEDILHPLIEKTVRERIKAVTQAPYIVLVVPLLVESGLFGDADRVVVVDVPEKVQIERLLARDGISEDQARAILSAQVTREERLERADEVIDNSGSPADLDREVHELHQRLI
jgi:dephospho-CoA kinase